MISNGNKSQTICLNKLPSTPTMTQVELLTPPLSVTSNTNSNGSSNCCRNPNTPAMTATAANIGLPPTHQTSPTDVFQSAPQTNPVDSFTFTDTALANQCYNNQSMSAGQNFDDFLSPPSSISSSGSNFSGCYSSNVCNEQMQMSSSSAAATARTGGRTMSNTPTMMANASSFYLHTPSPSPSSLSHSPAAASTYPPGTPNANYCNSNQTNFTNTFSQPDANYGTKSMKQAQLTNVYNHNTNYPANATGMEYDKMVNYDHMNGYSQASFNTNTNEYQQNMHSFYNNTTGEPNDTLQFGYGGDYKQGMYTNTTTNTVPATQQQQTPTTPTTQMNSATFFPNNTAECWNTW